MAQHIPLIGTPYLEQLPERIIRKVEHWVKQPIWTIKGSLKLNRVEENVYLTVKPIDKIGASLEIHLKNPLTGHHNQIEQIYYVA